MKHSLLRGCCAFLLLGIALTASIGVIAAVSEVQEKPLSLVRIRFVTQGTQTLRLYDVQGKLLETLQTDEQGNGTSKLLPTGEYYAACPEGLASFLVAETGTITVTNEGAQTDGQRLYFSDTQLGNLRIEREAEQEWYDYLLVGEDYRRREVVRCEEGERVECVFGALPYGSYSLEENGTKLCTVTVSAEKPSVVLSLP